MTALISSSNGIIGLGQRLLWGPQYVNDMLDYAKSSMSTCTFILLHTMERCFFFYPSRGTPPSFGPLDNGGGFLFTLDGVHAEDTLQAGSGSSRWPRKITRWI